VEGKDRFFFVCIRKIGQKGEKKKKEDVVPTRKRKEGSGKKAPDLLQRRVHREGGDTLTRLRAQGTELPKGTPTRRYSACKPESPLFRGKGKITFQKLGDKGGMTAKRGGASPLSRKEADYLRAKGKKEVLKRKRRFTKGDLPSIKA